MLCEWQARQSLDATKKRVNESEKRIDTSLEPFIKKNYWCAGPAFHPDVWLTNTHCFVGDPVH